MDSCPWVRGAHRWRAVRLFITRDLTMNALATSKAPLLVISTGFSRRLRVLHELIASHDVFRTRIGQEFCFDEIVAEMA